MKIRITLMTENDLPVSELGDNPVEKIKAAWDSFLSSVLLFSDDPSENGYVEEIEIVE